MEVDMRTNTVIHKTNLPVTVTLTVNEMGELVQLENSYKEGHVMDKLISDFNLRTTTNEGLFWFCYEKSFALNSIAYNVNLSIEVIEEIVTKMHVDMFVAQFVLYRLLTHPKVYRDLAMFKKVYDKAYKVNGAGTLGVASTSKETMSIDILMFLVTESHNEEKYVKLHRLPELRETFASLLVERKDEVQEWMERTDNVFLNSPFNWFLRIHALPITQEKNSL